LVLQYSVAGSDLENAIVTLDVAPGAVPISAASLQVPGGGLSGQISVIVRYGKWSFTNGETITHSANLNAHYTDLGGNGTVGPFSDNHSVTVSTVETINAYTNWTGQSVYVSTPGGQPGIVSEVAFFGSNLGTAPLDAGATLDFVLPAGVGFLEVVGPDVYFSVVSTPAQWQAGTVILVLIKPLGETFVSARPSPWF
jgi:hypothetical protein